MTENEILIVQISPTIPPQELFKIRERIIEEMKEKVVVLPYYAKAITVPEDITIKFEENDGAVAELEAIKRELLRNLCKACSCCPFDIGSCCGIQAMINSHIDKLKGEQE